MRALLRVSLYLFYGSLTAFKEYNLLEAVVFHSGNLTFPTLSNISHFGTFKDFDVCDEVSPNDIDAAAAKAVLMEVDVVVIGHPGLCDI